MSVRRSYRAKAACLLSLRRRDLSSQASHDLRPFKVMDSMSFFAAKLEKVSQVVGKCIPSVHSDQPLFPDCSPSNQPVLPLVATPACAYCT